MYGIAEFRKIICQKISVISDKLEKAIKSLVNNAKCLKYCINRAAAAAAAANIEPQARNVLVRVAKETIHKKPPRRGIKN